MKNRFVEKLAAAAGFTALTGAVLLAPATAQAAPGEVRHAEPRHTESIAACDVTDATLNWGTLERWRAYIQGSIAQGSWSEEGNVAYELPEFRWSEGEGIVAVTAEAGSVNFEGTVVFEGHDGLLNVTLGNPTLEIVDPTEAYLLLDLSSTKQSGEPDIEVKQERAVKLDFNAASGKVDGNTLTFNALEGQLTAEGAAAFGGFYSAGEQVDPVTVTMSTGDSGCSFVASDEEPVPAPLPEEDDAAEQQEPVDEGSDATENEADFPWLPVVIGGVALLVILGAGIMLFTGRKKTEPSASEPEGDADDAETSQEHGNE